MLRVHRQFIVLRYTVSHADSGRREEMLSRVALESANLLKVSLMAAAAMWAIWLLALVDTTNTAQAEDRLPENGKIAFLSYDDEHSAIYTVEPDGSNRSQLIKEGGYPNWSPDGREMSFVRMKENNGSVISVMSADGSNLRNFNPIEEFNGGPIEEFNGGPATWSPDGTKLAFNKSRISEDIYVVDLASSSQTNLTKTPRFDELYPVFSPNGSQICFFRYGAGGTGKSVMGIYVMDADGSDPTLLFELFHGPEQCDWSPDGKKVAVPEFGPGYLDIYVINADGSGRTTLARNSASDREPDWSPDAYDREPDWSPDGTKIVFYSDMDGGDYDIYTVDADGSDVAQVTNWPGDEISPDWQPLPGTTVHQPDTGGLSLLLVASALFFSGGSLLYAVVRRRM
jgi:TolB protein